MASWATLKTSPPTRRTGAPLVRKGRMTVANADASCSGYSAVSLLFKEPWGRRIHHRFKQLYKKQIGTHREKKHVLTLTLMLVRRKSACKTSVGSTKIVRWLAPLLGPNLDPKTGPKQRPKRRNENVIQLWTPFWGSAIGEFRCCPQMFCKQICDPAA